MSVPHDLSETVAAAIKSGYRWELDRAMRTNSYLRVFFSVIMLVYCGFGPGVLMRFPVSVGGVRIDPVTQFYAFRPVIFALVFVSLVCVLAALSRRAHVLFEAALVEDLDTERSAERRRKYIQNLRPSMFPFVLSGSTLVDVLIFVVALAVYAFWVVLLVETVPQGLGGHQVAGIVLGSYGLFAAIIIFSTIWSGLLMRSKKPEGQGHAAPAAQVRATAPTASDSTP
jgi:hypothetical protein